MATRAANACPDTEGDLAALERYAAKVTRALAAPGAAAPHGAHSKGSIREAEHDGHRIVVRTHYMVEVDGQPLDAMLSVDVDGQVTCHAIPAYSYPSAVDIVRRLIDLFPDDFPKPGRRKRTPSATGAASPPAKARPPAAAPSARKAAQPAKAGKVGRASRSARKAPGK